MALAAFAAPMWAPAEDGPPRKYAVLSLFGDTLNIVTYQGATGSRIDQNLHQSLPVSDGAFDKAALVAAEDELKRIDATSSVNLLATSSPELFLNQEKLFHGSRFVPPADLGAALRNSEADHLLLLTKYLGEAHLKAQNGELGSGMLEGIGFYMDPTMRMVRSDTGERTHGCLAPFLYMKISLIDLATSMVSRQEVITASRVLSAAREGTDPWAILAASEKVDTLREMIVREVTRVVAALVATPAADNSAGKPPEPAPASDPASEKHQ